MGGGIFFLYRPIMIPMVIIDTKKMIKMSIFGDICVLMVFITLKYTGSELYSYGPTS
jgi:hypothetical protein